MVVEIKFSAKFWVGIGRCSCRENFFRQKIKIGVEKSVGSKDFKKEFVWGLRKLEGGDVGWRKIENFRFFRGCLKSNKNGYLVCFGYVGCDSSRFWTFFGAVRSFWNHEKRRSEFDRVLAGVSSSFFSCCCESVIFLALHFLEFWGQNGCRNRIQRQILGRNRSWLV